MENVTAKSYTLKTGTGQWLAQIVLTSDGMISGVTDYGPIAYAWRAYGEKDFRQFLISLETPYFATKLYTGFSYMCHSKAMEKSCIRVAEKILPALQKALREELAIDATTLK